MSIHDEERAAREYFTNQMSPYAPFRNYANTCAHGGHITVGDSPICRTCGMNLAVLPLYGLAAKKPDTVPDGGC